MKKIKHLIDDLAVNVVSLRYKMYLWVSPVSEFLQSTKMYWLSVWYHEHNIEQNKVHLLELVPVVGNGYGPQIIRDDHSAMVKQNQGYNCAVLLNSLASKETFGTWDKIISFERNSRCKASVSGGVHGWLRYSKKAKVEGLEWQSLRAFQQ